MNKKAKKSKLYKTTPHLFKRQNMRRSQTLLDKRRDYVISYLNRNQAKQMKVVVSELSDTLFLTERTIYTIINEGLSTATKV